MESVYQTPRQIWAGQYAGIAILVVISLLATLGLTLVPEQWVWLLGLLPLGLGIPKLIITIRARNSGEQVPAVVATGLMGVVGVTVANGGDNIAAYTPVFRTITGTDIAHHGPDLRPRRRALVPDRGLAGLAPIGDRIIERWGHWTVPAVFILLGLYIFHKGGIPG